MDVTETPIERPQKKQKDFFSGKRGYHTLKSQLVADQNTGSSGFCVETGSILIVSSAK